MALVILRPPLRALPCADACSRHPAYRALHSV
jgi:hypothetical protein